MRRAACLILTFICTLMTLSAWAAAIEFTSGSKIQGAAAMLVFTGYGTTYQRTTSKYTATDENGNAFTVQDAAGSYLLVNIGYAPSSKQRTTIILTYENGDTGTACFEGGTFHPGAFLEVKTTTGRNNYCEDTYATLIASGATAETVTWQTSKDNATWSDVEGQTGLTADVLAPRGTTYYRFKQSATEISSSIAIVGQVCCTTVDEQDVVWKETFDDDPFPYPNITRNQCKWVKGYTFKSTGKVDDGYYVVVACSSAASPALCSWPSGKYDHTSGNGTSGFLIINAGAEKKIMYEQTITSDRGFCNGIYYNLSLYATNITAAGNAPARFSFDIVQKMNDGTEIEIVKDYDSGEIEGSSMENWYNYGVAFAPQDVENIESLVIRLWNTGGEVQGNDVVLDDISVSVCNARVNLFADYPNYDLTTDCGESVKLQAIEDGNLTTHFGRPDPYYLWMKSVDGGITWDSIHAASGFGMKEYTTVTKKGEQAIFKTIVATDGKAAQKAFDGTASGSCVIYTVTNESKVQCEGCVAPSVPQTEDQKVCVDATGVEYKATASTGCTLLWYESIDASVPLATKPTVDTSVAGEQSTYVSQKNDEDCESQRVKVKVTVVTGPTVSIEKSRIQFTCDTTQMTLKALPDGMTYQWGDGSTLQTLDIVAADTYSVKVTDQAGCSSDGSITIGEDKSTVTVTAKSVTGVTVIDCKVTSIELTAEVAPAVQGTTYLWSTGETAQNINVAAAGTYSVTATHGATGCQSDPSSITITASTDVPVIEVQNAMEACSPETIDIADAVISTTAETLKYYSDAALQQPLTDTKITTPVIAKYYIQGESSDGCMSEAKSVDVSLYELAVSVMKDSTIYVEGTAKLWAYGTGTQAQRYTMQFHTDGKPIGEKVTGAAINVNVTPADTTEYQLLATNGTCTSQALTTINVKEVSPIKIPKYFTPNGDGLNDVWHITNIEAFPNAIIYIYDRYSKLLVKLRGTDDGWDGTYNGHPMPMTDYWYVISDEELGVISGHFILKR